MKEGAQAAATAKGAATFRLTVKSVYASSGGTNVAITEVEFREAQ